MPRSTLVIIVAAGTGIVLGTSGALIALAATPRPEPGPAAPAAATIAAADTPVTELTGAEWSQPPPAAGKAGSAVAATDGSAAHPEPVATTPASELETHRRAVLDYLRVAYTFQPGDRLGDRHHRADDLLHPDNPAATTGVLVTSVPPAGATHQLLVTELALAVDTGSRTAWSVTTRLVEVRGDQRTPVAGVAPVTSQVVVTDWIEQPRVLEHIASPQPVP